MNPAPDKASPASVSPLRPARGAPAYWTIGLAVLVIAMVAIAICAAAYVREIEQLEQTNREREASRVRFLAYLFQHDLRTVASDLRMLAQGDALHAYLATSDPRDLRRAARRAADFSREHADYDRIRFLDASGREVFRIDQGGRVDPESELRDKADRPYFQAAKTLPPEGIYLSPFDLDAEQGAIARPLHPALRLAMPVFDDAGRQRGVCVINYAGATLLERLRKFAPALSRRLRVLNAAGYWIVAAHPDDEWGFLFPDRRDRTLAAADPALWRQLQLVPEGQLPHAGGLFTWYRFAPAAALGEAGGGDPFLIMGSEISAAEWSAVFASRRANFILVLIVFGGLVAGSLLLLRSRRRVLEERDRYFALSRDMLCVAGFDGYFKRLNPAWLATLGYAEADLRARPFIDFVHPEDRAATTAEAAKLAAGEDTVAFENRYLAKDGSYHWLSWNSRALAAERLIFGSARDITDRKAGEEKVQQLARDLQLQNTRLELANQELESFSYSVSHDLRAPLRHIDGFANLLADHSAATLDDKGRRYLATISDSARRMGRLIDDLLTFSRMGRARMASGLIDHARLIAEVIREGGYDHDPRIEWRIAPLPPVQADPAMMRVVWVNLIDNAVKYSARATPPCIEIGRLEPVNGTTGEQVFFVRDNGVGFDMQYAANLFGVFQRLHSDAEFEGTGIGLANVRRIITRHGGRAWASAAVGKGATIFFSLPEPPPS
ncbi:MAG TPA: ATP-binding protein [Opitutus sp.]|nr:ATP-binding protein [Opitutus sp.]